MCHLLFLARSYNLCSICCFGPWCTYVCTCSVYLHVHACSTKHIIALFLAQARPTDDYHLPSITLFGRFPNCAGRCSIWTPVSLTSLRNRNLQLAVV